MEVPIEMRRIILDFTISCLHNQPVDFVEHGRKYFTDMVRRRDERSSTEIRSLNIRTLSTRRLSVAAERYNPEEDSDSAESIVVAKSDEERRMLAAAVKKVILFRTLDPAELDRVLNAMSQRVVRSGEIIIQQGNIKSDNFYVIQEGVFEASVASDSGRSSVMRTYNDGGSFGELALLYNVARAATVTAMTDGRLWVLDRETFRKIVVKSAFRKRMRYESLIDNVEFLDVLTSYEKLDLADSLTPKLYSDKDIIFKQDDEADGMYFVESGAVNCTIEGQTKVRVSVKVVEAGGYFGELSLLTNKTRALSAYAIGPTKLAFLDKETFERLLGNCLDILSRNIDVYRNVMRTILGSNTPEKN